MDTTKEKRIIEILWLDLRTYVLWSRYLDLLMDEDPASHKTKCKLKILEKQIDTLEGKMLDISRGVCYTDIGEVKERYEIDFGNILFGFFQ